VNTYDLAGRTAIVTGGAGGFGVAIAEVLLASGAAVCLWDLAADRLRAAATQLRSSSAPPVTWREVDVTDEHAIGAALQSDCAQFSRLDILVNNAGILGETKPIWETDPADVRKVLEVNLMGAFLCTRAIVPVMRAQHSGSIILTASVAGLTAWSHAAPYCATKAAVIQLAKVAAVEYARDRVRVNCVCPGTFLSGIHEGLPQEAIDAIAVKHPLGLGDAADLLGAYSYLASDASRWTTGSALVVDGGYAAP